MDDLHVFDYLDNQDTQSCRNKQFYSHHDPLNDLPDDQFRRKYRMSKESFLKLLELVGDNIRDSTDSRGKPTSACRQLLIALRFYAVGTFHDVTGEMAGHSAGHVSNIIARVSRILSAMSKDFIRFPTDEEAKQVFFAG